MGRGGMCCAHKASQSRVQRSPVTGHLVADCRRPARDPWNPFCPSRGRHWCATPVMKCDIGHLHTPCTPNPNFHFTPLFWWFFWVPRNIPWHIPLVYYDPNLSHAS